MSIIIHRTAVYHVTCNGCGKRFDDRNSPADAEEHAIRQGAIKDNGSHYCIQCQVKRDKPKGTT